MEVYCSPKIVVLNFQAILDQNSRTFFIVKLFSQKNMEQQPHNPVPIELENQFLMRLPSEPASALRRAIQKGGSDLKDRLYIQLEPDNPTNG